MTLSDLPNGLRRRMLDSSAYVEQVRKKIESGEYPTTPTKCFCGAEDDSPLIEKDRYGFPHKMVICNQCALIRANPMMTEEAYKAFYNNEYRMINHPSGNLDLGDTKESDYPVHVRLGSAKGKSIIKWLDDADVDRPKTVLDIGCHAGGILNAFKEIGAETTGVEIDDSARAYTESAGHSVFSSLDEAVASGKKYDLIIMQDVIEHLVDLEDMLKVARLMAPNGHLYVWTPGLFRSNMKWYWQMAHTYQFCARSLEYVMGELGFDAEYTDENVISLWQYKGPYAIRYFKPSNWVEFVKDHVYDKEHRRMPPFRGQCKFTKKLLHENIGSNLSARVPDISAITDSQSGDCMVIAGGPSIDGQVEKIKELKNSGVKSICIARMLPWCIKNDFIPDYVVSVDCSEEQEKSFEVMPEGVTYLLASVTRPSIMEQLSPFPRYIFDSSENLKIRKMRAENGYNQCTVISSLGTVALTSLSVGMNLGFRKFHVFGVDFMMPDTQQTHADGIAGRNVKQHFIRVQIDNDEILTTNSFLDFANQALDLIYLGHKDGLLHSIKFYGESLINYMWDGEFHTDSEEAA